MTEVLMKVAGKKGDTVVKCWLMSEESGMARIMSAAGIKTTVPVDRLIFEFDRTDGALVDYRNNSINDVDRDNRFSEFMKSNLGNY